MKAALYPRLGPPSVVRIAEVPRPGVGPRDVLVRVRATTVTAGDWRLRSGDAPRGFRLGLRLAMGVFRPRRVILGTEFAGEVVAVGAATTRFAVGDKVFGARFGAHAEYLAVREDRSLAPVPRNLTLNESAPLSFGGTTALYYLRDLARVQPGERVLVNGASGSVGSAAVQLAKHFQAQVTGVCSAANLDLVRSLGADAVIDYTKEDFTRSGGAFDVVLDAVGNCSFERCAPSLAAGGRLLLVVATLGGLLGARIRPWRSGRKVLAGVATSRAADLVFLRELAEAGAYRPVIDRTYPFDRIVEAHAYVETGRKRGNVVVTLD
jgi:NADPH:quinone reductase-like Zn-dependent oxidoreductase